MFAEEHACLDTVGPLEVHNISVDSYVDDISITRLSPTTIEVTCAIPSVVNRMCSSSVISSGGCTVYAENIL